MKRTLVKIIIGVFVSGIVFWILLHVLFQPSLERNWTTDQKVLSYTNFNTDGTVTIENIRNIDYRSTTEYTSHYYSGTYDPKKIVRAWFLVEPFGSMNAAHTLVSFEFEDGKFLSISAEIRKEQGESFSPLKGLMRQYELVYVVADERDVIRLRTNYRKDDVRLYPIQGNNEKIQQVFIDMLRRGNKLAEHPEMYNTLTNNCTTNIASHVRSFSDVPLPWWNPRYLFPANIDELVYKLNLIDTDLSFEEARNYFYITDRAQKYDQDPEFSKRIREFGK